MQQNRANERFGDLASHSMPDENGVYEELFLHRIRFQSGASMRNVGPPVWRIENVYLPIPPLLTGRTAHRSSFSFCRNALHFQC